MHKPCRYLILGNFKSDEETLVQSQCPGDCLPFAYYYIDDRARKLQPIFKVHCIDLSFAKLHHGDSGLNYIFLIPVKPIFTAHFASSISCLTSRRSSRHDHEVLDIPIIWAHLNSTRNFQSKGLNIVNYLTDHGIGSARLSRKGFGAASPVDDNLTEAGQ
jgi:hypothetical protein